MAPISELLPSFLIGSLIGFLIISHIRDRFRSPFRTTFYFKTSGRTVTCNLSNVTTSNNGHTITWEAPSNWGQTMGHVTPDEIAAIMVRDRRKSLCL